MQLEIQLPDNLIVQSLIEQKDIPCLCKIKSGLFELLFQDPLPQATGYVKGWEYKEIDLRAPSGVGGEYTYYRFGMVTLKKETSNTFGIVDLAFFDSSYGWCPIFKNGKWCEPQARNTQEELDELEAMFPPRKLSRKRQKRLEAVAKIEEKQNGES